MSGAVPLLALYVWIPYSIVGSVLCCDQLSRLYHQVSVALEADGQTDTTC
jgi:hypothetical protein